jgi:hypothetical protein
MASAIVPTFDGGYVVAGSTESFGAGYMDVWVLKLDGQGNVQWQKTYGGPNWDEAHAIAPTFDGGYVVAGSTASFGAGYEDVWVLKLDGRGNVWWQKTYGGPYWDEAQAIVPTWDGGYVVAGNTFGAGSMDVWVLKLDGQGNVQWQKTYGGPNWDEAWAIVPTFDWGYVVAGKTAGRVWVLKLDGQGNVQWQKASSLGWYGEARAIAPTFDGGYIVAGRVLIPRLYYYDAWVLKLDRQGNVQWQKAYGGPRDDWASAIVPTSDGGYVMAGSTASFARFYDYDAWVLKLDRQGNVQWQKTYGGTSTDVANAIVPTFDGGYVVAGWSFGAGGSDVWVLKLEADGSIRGCPPDLVRDSTASVTSTTVSLVNSSAVVQTCSVSVRTSSATVRISTAKSSFVCRGAF